MQHISHFTAEFLPEALRTAEHQRDIDENAVAFFAFLEILDEMPAWQRNVFCEQIADKWKRIDYRDPAQVVAKWQPTARV